jgi:hypothetical protein
VEVRVGKREKLGVKIKERTQWEKELSQGKKGHRKTRKG